MMFHRRFDRPFHLLALLTTITLSACATAESVGRPPSAAEIARINDAVQEGRALAVLGPRVELPPPCPEGGCPQPVVQPIGRCAGGSCGEPSPRPGRDAPRTIASADGWTITFNTKLGGALRLPLASVAGVKVSGADRTRGALLGLAIGAGADAIIGGSILLLSRTGDTNSNSAPSCDAGCVEVAFIAMIPALVAGAFVGSAIGVPRYFLFDGAPPGP
jgi:hypothetical protein